MPEGGSFRPPGWITCLYEPNVVVQGPCDARRPVYQGGPSLPRVLGRQALEAFVDLRARHPPAPHHHSHTVLEVCEVVQRVVSQQHQVRALAGRDGSEVPVESQVMADVPRDGDRPALQDLLVGHAGVGHDRDLPVEGESRHVEHLRRIGSHEDPHAGVGQALQNALAQRVVLRDGVGRQGRTVGGLPPPSVPLGPRDVAHLGLGEERVRIGFAV